VSIDDSDLAAVLSEAALSTLARLDCCGFAEGSTNSKVSGAALFLEEDADDEADAEEMVTGFCSVEAVFFAFFDFDFFLGIGGAEVTTESPVDFSLPLEAKISSISDTGGMRMVGRKHTGKVSKARAIEGEQNGFDGFPTPQQRDYWRCKPQSNLRRTKRHEKSNTGLSEGLKC